MFIIILAVVNLTATQVVEKVELVEEGAPAEQRVAKWDTVSSQKISRKDNPFSC